MMERWEDVGYTATEDGDKQVMIGCQATDKEHKVNVKLWAHNEWTCALFCRLVSLSLSLSLWLLSLLYFYPRFLTRSRFPWEKTFLSFYGIYFSPAHTDSNQTSNYSGALRPRLCVWMYVVHVLFPSFTSHTHTHTHTRTQCQIPTDACYSPSRAVLLASSPRLIRGWGSTNTKYKNAKHALSNAQMRRERRM